MVIPSTELLTCSNDLDLSSIKDMWFYIAKVKAISTSKYEHQKDMKKDAKVILVYLKEYYPEYFILKKRRINVRISLYKSK